MREFIDIIKKHETAVLTEADQPDMSRRNFLRTAGKAAAAGAAMAAGMPAMAITNDMKEWNLNLGVLSLLNNIWGDLLQFANWNESLKSYYVKLLPYVKYANLAVKSEKINKNLFGNDYIYYLDRTLDSGFKSENDFAKVYARVIQLNPNFIKGKESATQHWAEYTLKLLQMNRKFANLPDDMKFWYILGYVNMASSRAILTKKWNSIPENDFYNIIVPYGNQASILGNNPLQKIYFQGRDDAAKKLKDLETQSNGNDREFLNKFNQEFIPHYKNLMKQISIIERNAK